MKLEKGYTLIELLIYIALVSLVFTGAIIFTWDLILIKEKSFQMNKQNYENFASLGRGSHLADSKNSLEEFTNELQSDQLLFTNLITRNSRNIQVTTEGFQTSWELGRPTLQSRYLLMNLIFAAMTSSGRDLSGVSLRNAGTIPIEIEQINLEWSGVPADRRVTEIQLDGGPLEWSGSLESPATININNYVLNPGQSIPLDFIRFNDAMGGGYLVAEFEMTDNSFLRSELELMEQDGEGGTEPPPCSEWCMLNGYSYGVCRGSSFWCWLYGGKHEPEADQFCTGGSSADTCCCQN